MVAGCAGWLDLVVYNLTIGYLQAPVGWTCLAIVRSSKVPGFPAAGPNCVHRVAAFDGVVQREDVVGNAGRGQGGGEAAGLPSGVGPVGWSNWPANQQSWLGNPPGGLVGWLVNFC